MFDIAQKIDNLDLSSELGMMLERTDEFISFSKEISFIQKTIEVLENSNLSQKRNFFIDNQERVTNNLNNLQQFVGTMDENDMLNNGDEDIVCLAKIVHIVLKHLEEGIEKFNLELKSEISSQTVKEDIMVSEDTIKDAMNNNNATQEIAKELNDFKNAKRFDNQDADYIDEQTAKIRNSFKDMKQQKKAMQQQFANHNRKQLLSVGYLITSQDFSDFRIVQGENLTKDALNKAIEKSGIEDAKVFKLTEMPTKKQTIQKTITVIG